MTIPSLIQLIFTLVIAEANRQELCIIERTQARYCGAERAMPIHNWTRVNPGVFHDFHNSWITEIRNALNTGILPGGFYALGEQVAGDIGPDVLALHAEGSNGQIGTPLETPKGAIAVAEAPPRVRFTLQAETAAYVHKQRHLVIRHSTGDRVVAVLEIVSSGNKSSSAMMTGFLDKRLAALLQGIHLTVIDLFPPSARDPNGMHGAIWSLLGDDSYRAPKDKDLTLAAYVSAEPIRAFVEPVAVGDILPNMALFLDPGFYVYVPLESTYQLAYRGVPQRWRDVLEKV